MPASRKAQKIVVFISYPHAQLSREAAIKLEKELDGRGHDAFLDIRGLEGGDEWAEKIYDRIRRSDVLIVLLEEGTENREWVQREVDVARGAHVSILPLALHGDAKKEPHVKSVQEKLAIDSKQFIRFGVRNPDFNRVTKRIESLRKKTHDNQKAWAEDLKDGRIVERAATNKSAAIYEAPGKGSKCRLHLATGDIAEMRNIDVVVNSENDYMQMARIHESTTLSSNLRRLGSLVDDNERIQEDTVQRDLDEYVSLKKSGRPLPRGHVIATRAGHPKSKLAANHTRYIFHAVSVQIDPNVRNPIPISGQAITQITCKCLEKVEEVNRNEGVISYQGSPLRDEEFQRKASYRKIESIIFPSFGTGHGGSPLTHVVPHMAEGIKDFLRRNPRTSLKRIHLSVFGKHDVADVQKVLDQAGFKKVRKAAL